MVFPFYFFVASVVEMRCGLCGFGFLSFILFFHLYRLGIRREDLPKHEEQLELKISKAQLEELKKDALEAMETQKKRYVVDACWPSYSNHFLLEILISGRPF